MVVVVALTREEGKNDKLRTQIQLDDDLRTKLNLLELPCIAHASGPDYDKLPSVLASQRWDYVTVTSPEAAKVLVSVWEETLFDNYPPPPLVAAVGKATEKALVDAGIPVAFCPTKATAATLVVELELKEPNITPNNQNDTATESLPTTVLYPASVRAQETLATGLSERGFDVTRLNTYDTVTASWTDAQKTSASHVQVACFASPSSVKGWFQNTNQNTNVWAACIGETSARACRELGWKEERIIYPDKPGLEGWVRAIEEAAEVAASEQGCGQPHQSRQQQVPHPGGG